MNIKEAREFVGETEGLEMDGFDDCIVEVAERCSKQPLLVYDREKIADSLMKDKMTYEEAQEYIDFNMAGAWMGEGTPLIITMIDED